MAGQSANLQGEIQLGAGGIIPSGGGSGGGISGNIEVVDTLTAEPEVPASVENIGTSANVKLRFTIPRGEKGEKGDEGDSGVYIGTEEPTKANVWLDPSDDPEHTYYEDLQEEINRLNTEMSKRYEMLSVNELPANPDPNTLYLVMEG